MKPDDPIKPIDAVTRTRDLIDRILVWNKVSRLVDNTFLSDDEPEALINLPQPDGSTVVVSICHTKEG